MDKDKLMQPEVARHLATKVENLDPVDQVYGQLGRGRRTDEIIRQLRENK